MLKINMNRYHYLFHRCCPLPYMPQAAKSSGAGWCKPRRDWQIFCSLCGLRGQPSPSEGNHLEYTILLQEKKRKRSNSRKYFQQWPRLWRTQNSIFVFLQCVTCLYCVRPFKKIMYCFNAFLVLIMLCGWSSYCVPCVLEVSTITMMPFPLVW